MVVIHDLHKKAQLCLTPMASPVSQLYTKVQQGPMYQGRLANNNNNKSNNNNNNNNSNRFAFQLMMSLAGARQVLSLPSCPAIYVLNQTAYTPVQC